MTYTSASGLSGGMVADIGYEAAGFTTEWGVEYNARIAAIASRNLAVEVLAKRIQDVDFRRMPKPWLLHMSPVCKSFSQAKTDGIELWQDIQIAYGCARAIINLRPRVVVVENVWGYRDSVSFGIIRAALTEAGYTHDFWHLNFADYGVPQTRKRLILVAYLGTQKPTRPTPTHAGPPSRRCSAHRCAG